MTPDKDTARAAIARLVENFHNTPKRQRDGYNEQQTREYFILPLFRALGWDTANPAEFSAEEQISRGFVDFSFSLNGVPAFYLETKRIAEGVTKPDHMKQAMNYAYLRGVTWAVLSDFEDLVIFNAEWETRNPIEARFLEIHHQDYAGDRFDDLWLLSRESMQQREIDHFAERVGRKRKKAPITDLLFKQLTLWRRDLFEQFRQWNQDSLWGQDYAAMDSAVQQLLDRLIFIRTMEDRGIEPNRLLAMARQYRAQRGTNKNLFRELQALFRELDSIYNSNLFAQSQIDLLEIYDDVLLNDMIHGLYFIPNSFNTFDFSAISADVLGAIYEQYLGFKGKYPQANEALSPGKEEKRKTQGIYYTPQFVVRYIVQNTLGKRLAELKDDPAAVHRLRVLDPACGSGSFLIEAFDVLDRHLSQHGDDTDRTNPSERRLNILRRNLYGVDLDPQAVEVTRLNLVLRAALSRDKLPLLTHIQYGNSLIDDPAVAGDSAFDWTRQFPAVMAAGGFDIVVGNPPYGAKLSTTEDTYLSKKYKTYIRTKDVYTCFIEICPAITKEKGIYSYIVPNAWLGGHGYIELREFFLIQKMLEIIVMPYDVFKDAYIDTLIFISDTAVPEDAHVVKTFEYPKKEPISNIDIKDEYSLVIQRVWGSIEDKKFVLDYQSIVLIRKLQESTKDRFSDVIDIKRGVLFDQELLTKTKKTDDHYLFFEGDIYRYDRHDKLNRWVKYGSEMKEYPKSFEWFEGERLLLRRLINRQHRLMATYVSDTFITNKNIYTVKPKLQSISLFFVLGIINSKLISFLFLKQVSQASKDDFPQITIHDIKQLPFPRFIPSQHNDLVNYVTDMLRLKQELAAAERTFDDRRHALAEQIAHLDRQIDALVYELYGLDDDEIALIEASYPSQA